MASRSNIFKRSTPCTVGPGGSGVGVGQVTPLPVLSSHLLIPPLVFVEKQRKSDVCVCVFVCAGCLPVISFIPLG